MTVCHAHGGRAPQVREAARLRLACLLDPALKVYADILKANDHPDAFKVAKDVLDRNRLMGYGTPEDPKNIPYAPQPARFDVSKVKFNELSD